MMQVFRLLNAFPHAIGEEMAHGYEGEVIVCCFSEEDAEVYRELLSC